MSFSNKQIDFNKLKLSTQVQSTGIIDEYGYNEEDDFRTNVIDGFNENHGPLPVEPEKSHDTMPIPVDDEGWIDLLNEVGRMKNQVSFEKVGSRLIISETLPIYPKLPPPKAYPSAPALMVHPKPKKLGKECVNRRMLGYPNEEYPAPPDWDHLLWTTQWGRFMLHLMKKGFKVHRWMAKHPTMAGEMEWTNRKLVPNLTVGARVFNLNIHSDQFTRYDRKMKKDKYWFARSRAQRFAFIYENNEELRMWGMSENDMLEIPI